MTSIRHTQAQDAPSATLAKIVIGALAIRWLYSLTMYASMGDAGLLGVDSGSFLAQGQLFAAGILDHRLSGWQLAGTYPYMMPLFTWMIGACVLAFGKMAALGYVMAQGAVDTATCYLVYRVAQVIDERIAVPAAVAAAINPTQIVLAGLLYTDTPFVFFVALLLYGGVLWLSAASSRAAVIAGIAAAGGVLCRPVMAAWVLPMLIILAVIAAVRGRLRKRAWGQLAAIVVIFAIGIAPILFRHYAQFGAWSLTPQTGMHLNRWIVPLVREAQDGTPWLQGYHDMEKKTFDRYGPTLDNPFEQSKRYFAVAVEELHKIGPVPVLKAWVYGAAINLGAPAAILSPPVALLPRTGFYGTPGASMPEKIWNYLFGGRSGVYALVLLGGIAGVMVFRLVQAVGAGALLLDIGRLPAVLLLVGWVGYILVVNGPIASPKYRLPIEPVLCVLTGRGWIALRRRSAGTPSST